MRANPGWTLGCALVALGSLASFVRTPLAEPATPETSCEEQCEAVLHDCKQLCIELASAKMGDYKGASGEQSGSCFEKCQADIEVCRSNC